MGFPCLSLSFVSVGRYFVLNKFLENYETKNMTQIPLFIWIQMHILLSVSKTLDQEQASTCEDLHLLSSTKWYQQSICIYIFVQGFARGFDDWVQQWWGHKQMKLSGGNSTIYPSQHFTNQTQERFFISCLSPLFEFEPAYWYIVLFLAQLLF